MSHMPRYKLIKEKAYGYRIYPYRNETSLLYHNKQKQAIAIATPSSPTVAQSVINKI